MPSFKTDKKRAVGNIHSWHKRFSLKVPKFVQLRPIRRTKTLILLICLSLFLLGCGIFTLTEKPHLVKHIECLEDQHTCPADLLANFTSLTNKNLFSLPSDNLIGPLLFKRPELGKIVVSPHFPGTVKVLITTRQPVAYIEDQTGLRLAIDKENKIFPLSTAVNLPLIKTHEAVAAGESAVSTSTVACVRLIGLLNQSALAVNTLSPDGSGTIEVILSSGIITRFSDEKDLVKQVDTLKYILGERKVENEKLTIIDVRFDNPVIK